MILMPPKRQRQRTLFEFTSSPSPAKHSSPIKERIEVSSEDDDSDPGRIKFERDVIEDTDQGPSDAEEPAPRRRSARIQKTRKRTSISASLSRSTSVESDVVARSRRNKRSRQLIVNSDESDNEKGSKKRKLVPGRRPGSPVLEEDEVLIEEVDEDRILESRLRDLSKKSAYVQNLERLQRKAFRRRRGQLSASESEDEDEDEEDEGADEDDNPSPVSPTIFKGARPTVVTSDEDKGPNRDGPVDENEDDFIVQDDGEDEVPELPTMFSMGTFQDLSHHFKVICQLFVHLAVKRPHKRRSFMKDEMKKNYFTVPLTIARRKLSGMKDSLVASSVWKPDFKQPLETFPDFRLEHLDFSIPLCDACHLGNRVATLRGVISGQKYDLLTFEPLVASNVENEEEESNKIEWNLGRFCASRAQVFHTFTHWEHILYHTLRAEVERFQEASSQGSGMGQRVFLPATRGVPPPDDPDDADGIMDWLDGRGIINAQWVRMKEMMERARKLDGGGKNGEDDIDIG